MNWISVKDRLPEAEEDSSENEYYLIWVPGYGWQKAMFVGNQWWSDYTSKVHREVTHWCEVHKPKFE